MNNFERALYIQECVERKYQELLKEAGDNPVEKELRQQAKDFIHGTEL